MGARYEQLLDNVTRVRGVMGAMLVSTDDGLVVAESLMEGVRGNAVAALAASLYSRFGRLTESVGVGSADFLQLQGQEGALVITPADRSVIVVAVADPVVNVGLIRIEMMRVVEAGL